MKTVVLLLSISLCSVLALGQDCTSVTITGGNGQITVSGISGAPIAGIQVFNSSWASVFNQTYTNPASTINVPMTAGQYFVNVRYYSAAWAILCEKAGNATVTSGTPPPTQICGGTFAKTFGTTAGDEEGNAIVKTTDGNFIIAGNGAASGATNHDGIVMKVDNAGNLLWSKTLGGAQEDFFTHMTATSDGGCLAAGTTNSSGYTTYTGDCWVTRFDGAGNLLWQKRYFLNGSAGVINGIRQTSDGGFALSATFPFTPGASDWMVLKVDASGNIQWQKKLGSANSDGATDIVEDNHGTPGLVVCGIIYIGTFYDAVITKLDMAGNVLWTKAYDFDSRSNWLLSITPVSDGFLYHTTNESGWNKENATAGVLKTDFNGNIIWNKEFSIPNCRDSRMTVLPDESILLVQGEFPHEDPAADIYLAKITSAGNVVWSKKYPRANGQFLWGLAADGNNYAMGTGFTVANAYKDILVSRVDLSSGKMGDCSATDVTITTRTPNAVILNFNWLTNTTLALSTAAPTYPVTTFSPDQNVLCSDPCPNVTISSPTVNENAGNAVLQVCIASPAASTLVYSYTTANGTATSGSDYTGGAGTVTIQAGQTCGTISIPIINDAEVESAETFTVSIGGVTGTVTINDDDQATNNCSSVTVTPGDNKITVTGVTAPVATVQVFNSNWATVFNQTYTNSPGTVNVNIGPGTYLVKVTFYNANWAYVCDKTVDNVTVINTCPAGTICVTNTCPSASVNLNTAYAIPNLPSGAVVTWHTGTPATDANKMTDAEAQNVTVPGTYYAAINIGSCYSATIPVKVTIVPCSTPSMETRAVQLVSEDSRVAKNITAFPNPFTRSVRVVIDSEKREKATVALMDMQGRQLKQVPVQLVPGSNTVLLEGLDQFASGNYFLRVSSDKETKTLKLVRQQ